MMNICFFIAALDGFGGTIHVTSLIANGLVRKGYNVSILVLVKNGEPKFKIDKKIKITYLLKKPVSLMKYYPYVLFLLRKFVKKKRTDFLIVVETTLYLYPLLALLRLKTRIIVWEHFNFHITLGNWKRWLSRVFAKRYADAIVTLTDVDRKFWIEEGKSKVQIHTIPNPIPFDPKKTVFSTNSKKVISIGRFTTQKGFDNLIHAWTKLATKPDIKEWTLHIIGEGDEKIKLEQQISLCADIKNSIFLEEGVENISYWYNVAGIYCLSSRFEGLPMVLLEAMGYGIPIVAFDCPTGPADLIKNGKNGTLVQANDVCELAESLYQLMKNSQLRLSYSKSGFNICVEKYRKSRIIQMWIKLFDSFDKRKS